MGFLRALADGSVFGIAGLTPHGFCLTWNPGLLWLHAGSDALIFLAYFSIPLTLIRLIRVRNDPHYRWISWLFVSFILACGTTHALSILTLWVPAYAAEGLLKLLTAILSVVTAVALVPLVPVVLTMPSRAEITRLNGELQARVIEQDGVAAALREHRTRLLLAQEAGQVGSWDLNLFGDTIHWSDGQFVLYGLEPVDPTMRRQDWLALLDPVDREMVAARLAEAALCDTDYEAEFRLHLPDGGVRWIADRGRVVASDGAGDVRMVGVSVDITERKRLAESNQRLTARVVEDAYAREQVAEQFRVLFEHSPDGLFMLRVEGGEHDPQTAQFVFEAISPATGRLTGLPVASFIGLRPDQTHRPEQAAQLLATYRDCLAKGPLRVAQQRIVAGREREFETSLAPVRDTRSGRVSRIIGVARDVTERSEMERQMRNFAKIEATNRLTAGIAHDFNNLLQALMGGLEMLLLEVELPSSREYAEVALHAARRGAELTHRLLAFSRQQTLQPQPVDTASLLGFVTGLLERTLPPRIRLVTTRPPAPTVVIADPGQLEAALVNLVVNAADAMPGGGRIEVSAAAQAPPPELGLLPGRYARLAVIDTGAGMDAAVLQQCCEPFFTTKGPHGSGLGLSMVQGFARQSGGELRIRSAPAEGTAIEIWLPAAAVPAASVAASVAAGSPAAAPAAAPAHVLLVDDAPDVLVTAGAFLRHGGYLVTRVASAEQALDHLQQGGPCDALVTDFAMPDMDGVELLARARALRADLPALIITGFDRTTMHVHESGVRVLRKPFGRVTLADEVAALLGHGGVGAAPQELAPSRCAAMADSASA